MRQTLIIAVILAVMVGGSIAYAVMKPDDLKPRLFQFCEKHGIPLRDCKLPKRSYVTN